MRIKRHHADTLLDILSYYSNQEHSLVSNEARAIMTIFLQFPELKDKYQELYFKVDGIINW